jgi:diguanylate cyclase (GGDEF)-like protein/excisionase family DNA binding protein/PAS domain S-box-containing protein
MSGNVTDTRLEAALDPDAVATVVLAPSGRFRYVNPAFVLATARTVEELASLTIWDVIERQASDGDLSLESLLEHDRLAVDRRCLVETRWRWFGVSATSLRDDHDEQTEIIVRLTDVTEERRTHSRLIHEPREDPLTGLPSVSVLRQRLEATLEEPFDEDAPGAVLFVDIDGFRTVNASLGRATGDQMLTAIAQRLRGADEGTAFLARVGGDQFALLLKGVSQEQALEVTRLLREAIALPLQVASVAISGLVSTGVAMIRGPASTADGLLSEAESAAALAKRRGGDQVAIFDDEARERLYADVQLELDLRRALDRDELVLVFQPTVDMGDRTIVGFEAFPRWRHPTLGDISPEQFLPLAERSTLILQFGDWFLRSVCTQLSAWRAAGLDVPPVSLNISPRQLAQADFGKGLRELLEKAKIPPEAIVLEVAETAPLSLPESPTAILRELQSLGFRTMLDEFGTGCSSLSDLEEFPLYGVKIDHSFIAQLPDGPHAIAIVGGVLKMGEALGLRVVATGVDTTEQAQALHSLGCLHGQGQLFSRPLAGDLIPAVLEDVPGAAEASEEQTMHLGAAAQALGVSTSTVRRWIDNAKISAVRTSGGHRRIRRSDVERERRRRDPGPTVRSAQVPEHALPHVGAVVLQRSDWLCDISLRSLYVGDDHGWFGTPGGRAELDCWLQVVGQGLESGDFVRVTDATTEMLRAARGAGVPLPERVSLLDSLAQAASAALAADHAGAEEMRDWHRTARVLRQLAVRDGH